MFSLDYSGAIYGIGEYLIHYTVMYAMLHNEKVFLNGKKISLYDAFDKVEKDGNAELIIKPGVKLVERDGFGNETEGRELTSLDDEYISNFRRKIRNVNQECHGAMNTEDRGMISQRLAGRMVMQFRQWMVEHFSRRYRGLHWDGSSKQWTEGWWVTTAKWLGMNSKHMSEWSWKSRLTTEVLKETIAEYQRELQNRTLSDAAFNSLEQKAKLAKKQIKNLRMTLAEVIATSLLIGGQALWWGLDPDEDNPLLRFCMYQLKRLSWDALSATPIGVPKEGVSLMERPMPSVGVVTGLFYMFPGGLISGDMFDTYESGIHKGENKYLVKTGRQVAPFYKDFENYQKMMDEGHKYWHDMIIPYDLGRSGGR